MSDESAKMTLEEFTARFTEYCLTNSGFSEFDDGQSVANYCAEIAKSYYDDKLYRSDGPEVCAESDMGYWGEE